MELTLYLRYVALLVVTAQASAALLTYPSAKLSEAVGRKLVLYLACGLACGALVWIASDPWAIKTLFIGAALYGIAEGAYVSVDYALALDCLPNGRGVSEALSLWNVSEMIGATLGSVGYGVMLDSFKDLNAVQKTPSKSLMDGHSGKQAIKDSDELSDHYTYSGYFLVLIIASCSILLCGAFVFFVRKST